MRSALCWFLFCVAPLLAGPPGIEGPDRAGVGDLVMLKAEADSPYTWVFDKDAFGKYLTCNDKKVLIFSPTRAGRYVAWLVVWKDKSFQTARHVVVVEGGDSRPVLPPEKPPKDDDKDKVWDELIGKIKDLIDGMEDPATAALLKEEWSAALPRIRSAKSIDDAGKEVSAAFERAMRRRKGLSRYRDWLRKFRKPLNGIIKKLVESGVVDSPEDVAKIIELILKLL